MHLILSFLLSFSSPQQQAGNAKIIVTVSGIEETTGVIRISLFNDEKGFLHHSFKRQQQEVQQLTIQEIFEDVPEGTYAISIYHDINSNGKLDSNFLRIPKEPYGFSNNPSTTFGPPDFEGASFSHTSKGVTYINIKL
ncbi:DUF2141 domain-containing protein [Ekhidna sp.]